MGSLWVSGNRWEKEVKLELGLQDLNMKVIISFTGSQGPSSQDPLILRLRWIMEREKKAIKKYHLWNFLNYYLSSPIQYNVNLNKRRKY